MRERETENEREGGKKEGEDGVRGTTLFYHWGEMRILQFCRFQVGFRSSFWYRMARNKEMRCKVKKVAE